MVTRLLHCCGLELGPESELMPAQRDNPEGFWEHLGFVALNDELLSELGGAWDLPPKPDEDFTSAPLDPLRLKAQLLIEKFDSASVWGWKDPRNSLTLPFWQQLLPALKTVVVVRNPLEVAHSMRQRNGTSWSFGLRLWEIYNRRFIEVLNGKDRLITHYDFFFQEPELELRRITDFIGLHDAKTRSAAALVAPRKRHTHFTIEQLIDARVAPEAIELYRILLAEASPGKLVKPSISRASSSADDLLPGSVSRLHTFVPERIAQIEELYRELLEQAETRHKAQVEELSAHLTQAEARHKSQVNELIEHVAQTEARYKSQIEEISAHYTGEIMELNELVRTKSISLAESEARAEELRNRLRKQLQSTKRLSRILDDVGNAASQLRLSLRWQIANPMAALKAKLAPEKARKLLGYGHLEKVVSSHEKWRTSHPEISAIDYEIQALISGESRLPQNRTPAGTETSTFEPPVPTRPIEFPFHEQVEVSIIIPVFNQLHFTQACLASLQEHQGAERFEVIVVDDCSADATGEAVPRMPGVVYLRNQTNFGFISSCNRGAENARGKYLVFLNNDTLVKPDWLAALVDTFVEEPNAGIVGSKLLYPDGRLQEAGGIIWRDASGWNFGKFDDPGKPEYNYLREVDYCSAAALMVPKTLFEGVGGFDSRYAPGYYEDTDLAFKLRRAGYKVLYQPLSEVIHYEGATGGTDLSTGAKKHQAINQSTFAEAWADELITKPANGDVAFLREPPPGRKNILVIDHHLPMPDRDSGSLRMFQILKLLHKLGHRVTFVPDNLAGIPPYAGELQKRGIQVIQYPHIKKVRDYLIAHGSEFDIVVLSRCQFARKHVADVHSYLPQSRIIFDTVDLHFLREESEARLTGDLETRRKAQETKQQEYELIEQSDETWVVSSTEQRLLRKEWPDKSIQLVSNIVNVFGSKTPFALRRDWLFIGGFQHPPNIDAVLFFLGEIYPLVSERLGDAKFYIIGDKTPPEIVALATEKIIVAGLQRDVRPFFDNVRLSVAPLRFGAGVKGKINQSMAFGVPVVATSLGVEGTDLRDREDIMVANEPEDFARALVELYESEELWNRLSENGIRKTRALYSVEAARENLKFLFSDEHMNRSEQSPAVADKELALTGKV
jgi:GT2 family glycosyltransferase/glycosyltransferase involved in cell wall biosynthesis